jgi:PTH1 family peptidyl-tRNA hydrolase
LAGLEALGARLVLGLGNPGPRYAGTRHNLGADVVRELGRRHVLKVGRQSLNALWEKGRVGGVSVILALPQTFMNLSGQAAVSLMHYFDIGPDRMVVVHDDLDLELGRLKIARKGGAGGHKGVQSIIQHVGVEDFIRLKVGIGRPRYEEPVENYVLNGWYADQRELVEKVVDVATDCLETILIRGVAEAMQQFHSVSTGGGEG